MSVNGFDCEEEMSAAYDAAERALWHALDEGLIELEGTPKLYPPGSEVAHKTVAMLARRIADAVIHSSAADITDMGLGVTVERVERISGTAHPVPQ